MTGLPLPRRAASKLILRIVWPDLRNGGHVIDVSNTDPLLRRCLGTRRAFGIGPNPLGDEGVAEASETLSRSDLIAAAGGPVARLIAVPIHDLNPYQGCVVIAGQDLDFDPATIAGLEYYCLAAFRTLIEVGRLDPTRPGELSDRERHVLTLSAAGKTASEIAGLLEISQRTVHAHLQNACDKMNAANKTQTVVEALRYGQIVL
ncbi:helix-turn-helix transcriptional regulator [Siculibacillus lacustris]|uniref:helix-turn-helix transcriptional regulator n=1 Tax=Siculibacillus lacustris TaxID=1549641 RepID=UPI0019D0E1A6|nr:helix-turn-helix domain-containing protein [Siculibacillus lacustris]